MLAGCGSTKVVYPEDCAVVSNIAVEKPDPEWMQPPAASTKLPDTSNPSNSSVLDVITQNNGKWKDSNDKLVNLQAYVKTLMDKGVIK